jgi:hypothetical protein
LTVSWDAPTENQDGSALTDLAAYRVYYGLSPRNYLDWTEVDDSTATNVDVSLASGSYYVAMTAINLAGAESGYSNEVLMSTE